MTRSWQEIRAAHDAAAADFAAAVRAIAATPDGWTTAPAEGSWSPAQVTRHLILAFEAAQRELLGGVLMALRTTAWQRLFLRFTYQRRLMRQGLFPAGARAPREVRPPAAGADVEPAAATIAHFERAAADFMSELEQALQRTPGARITHPYFGPIPLPDAAWISARHVDHHRRRLPVP
jgi:hypothetical protein